MQLRCPSRWPRPSPANRTPVRCRDRTRRPGDLARLRLRPHDRPGYLFHDEFDGPAGSSPDPAKWNIFTARETIRNPVFWDRPENMGQYRNDRRNVFLDGNSNLVIRATKENGKYFGGKLMGNVRGGINHTFEARVKFDCLTDGAWPAWWLINEDPARGGEVDMAEWYGNRDWPSGTTVHARLDGTSFATIPNPIDSGWHVWRVTWNDSGMYFWKDYAPGMEPYFEVPHARWRTGPSTTPATSWPRSSTSRLVAPVAAIPAAATTPPRCSSTGCGSGRRLRGGALG